MKLVAFSDIFGKTVAFQGLISRISPGFSEVELVTPYGNETQKFGSEEEAYHTFSTEIGIDSYTKILLSKLEGSEATEQLLLGFSVGATAIWLASANLGEYGNTKAICFYSSQIRNHLSLKPQIPIEFYFAKAELKYQVDAAIAGLGSTPNVKCHKTNYLHGFMNQDSLNYNSEGFHNYLSIIKKASRTV